MIDCYMFLTFLNLIKDNHMPHDWKPHSMLGGIFGLFKGALLILLEKKTGFKAINALRCCLS